MGPTCAQCNTPLLPTTAICPACRALQRPSLPTMGPGTHIERGYARIVVDARIGAGAMGVVWRAWMFHAPNGPRASEAPTPIALKQLRPQISLNKEIRALFMNEAEALLLLSHPNVVRFYDLFEWMPPPPPQKTKPVPQMELAEMSSRRSADRNASLTLAMEYVDGNTLEDVISRHAARARIAGPGALPGIAFRRAIYYFEQLLGALGAAHAIGIIHRDVKPSNVMIRGDGIVKLTDFGIAHLKSTTRSTKPDDSGASLAPGTGAYMSPEQVLGKPLDGRSDLYAAAIVLYEMLSGGTPFSTQDKSEIAIRMDQVEAPPPRITSFVPQAPPSLDAVFARALAKDPAHRYPTAIALGTAFLESMGLPPNRAWLAQAEMARLAGEPGSGTRARKLETLRVDVEHGYKTLQFGSR